MKEDSSVPTLREKKKYHGCGGFNFSVIYVGGRIAGG